MSSVDRAGMELDEFVKQAITQVVAGAASANQDLQAKGAVVFPACVDHGNGALVYDDGELPPTVSQIHFDVAITSAEQSEKSGKFGIVVASIGLGANASNTATTTSLSRVSFDVPVLFPQNKRNHH